MNTLQQIAAGFGASLIIGLMTAGQNAAMAKNSDTILAMSAGLHYANLIGGIILACAFVASFLSGTESSVRPTRGSVERMLTK